jgi:hypothetical protein
MPLVHIVYLPCVHDFVDYRTPSQPAWLLHVHASSPLVCLQRCACVFAGVRMLQLPADALRTQQGGPAC